MPRYSRGRKLVIHPTLTVDPDTYQTHPSSQSIKFNISYCTLKQIHTAILSSETVEAAADHFNVKPALLSQALKKIRYKNQLLNFQQLKAITVEEIQNELGNKYNQAIRTLVIALAQYNFNEIHEVIRTSKNIRNAAIRLGASKKLSLQILLTGADLNFTTLKNSAPQTLRDQYGDVAYYSPLIACIKKQTFTLKDIHIKVLQKKAKSLIAAEFGVKTIVITDFLKQFSYLGHPLTYTDLTFIPKKKARSMWKEDYEKPSKMTEEVDLGALENELNAVTNTDISIPTEKMSLIKSAEYSLARSYFFNSEYTPPLDAVLTSTNCTTTVSNSSSSTYCSIS